MDGGQEAVSHTIAAKKEIILTFSLFSLFLLI
jgi:hypothetical protein